MNRSFSALAGADGLSWLKAPHDIARLDRAIQRGWPRDTGAWIPRSSRGMTSS